jgi:hypothetical protein
VVTDRTAAEIAFEDQVAASIADHMSNAAISAHGIAEFYNVLKANGVPPNLAANLTRSYADYAWSGADDET